MIENVLKYVFDIPYSLIVIVSEDYKKEQERFLNKYNTLEYKPRIITLLKKHIIFENKSKICFFPYEGVRFKGLAPNKIYCRDLDKTKHREVLEAIWPLTSYGCEIREV